MTIRWHKSSRSGTQAQCVEVARLDDGTIGIRDSKDPGGPTLRIGTAEWLAFLEGVARREFDKR